GFVRPCCNLARRPEVVVSSFMRCRTPWPSERSFAALLDRRGIFPVPEPEIPVPPSRDFGVQATENSRGIRSENRPLGAILPKIPVKIPVSRDFARERAAAGSHPTASTPLLQLSHAMPRADLGPQAQPR